MYSRGDGMIGLFILAVAQGFILELLRMALAYGAY